MNLAAGMNFRRELRSLDIPGHDMMMLPIETIQPAVVPSGAVAVNLEREPDVPKIYNGDDIDFEQACKTLRSGDGHRFMDASRIAVSCNGRIRYWVGGIRSRREYDKWSIVINATSNLELHHPDDIRVPVKFGDGMKCLTNIQVLIRMLVKSMKYEDQDILIHCFEGANRSAFVAFCLFYYMKPVESFVPILQHLRPEINNYGAKLVMVWEREVDTCGLAAATNDLMMKPLPEPRKMQIKIGSDDVDEKLVASWNIGAKGIIKTGVENADALRYVFSIRPRISLICWQEFLNGRGDKLSDALQTLYELSKDGTDIGYKTTMHRTPKGALTAFSILESEVDDWEVAHSLDICDEGRISTAMHLPSGETWINSYSPNAKTTNEVVDPRRICHDKKIDAVGEDAPGKSHVIGDVNVQIIKNPAPACKGMPSNQEWERESAQVWTKNRIRINQQNGTDRTFISWSYPRWAGDLDEVYADKDADVSDFQVHRQTHAKSTKLGPYDHACCTVRWKPTVREEIAKPELITVVEEAENDGANVKTVESLQVAEKPEITPQEDEPVDPNSLLKGPYDVTRRCVNIGFGQQSNPLGNPFRISRTRDRTQCLKHYREWICGAREFLVAEHSITDQSIDVARQVIRLILIGSVTRDDMVCSDECQQGKHCHADVLIEVVRSKAVTVESFEEIIRRTFVGPLDLGKIFDIKPVTPTPPKHLRIENDFQRKFSKLKPDSPEEWLENKETARVYKTARRKVSANEIGSEIDETVIYNGEEFHVKTVGADLLIRASRSVKREIHDVEFMFDSRRALQAEAELNEKTAAERTEKATRFNKEYAEFKKSPIIGIIAKMVGKPVSELGQLIQSLMYDDITSGGADAGETMYNTHLNLNENANGGGKFGPSKAFIGVSRVVLIGKVGIGGHLCLEWSRIQPLITGNPVPLFAADLKHRLHGIQWESALVLFGSWPSIHRQLVQWTKILADKEYSRIKKAPNAVLACRAIQAMAALNIISPVDEEAVLKGSKILVAIADGNVDGGCHGVLQIDAETWESNEENLDLKPRVRYVALENRIEAGDEQEPGDGEINELAHYFVHTDPKFAHLPRYIVNDSITVLRRSYHICTSKSQSKKVKYLQRCFAQQGVKPLSMPREAVENIDVGGRIDERYLARTATQRRFCRPNDLIRELFGQQRKANEFDESEWDKFRKMAGRAPSNCPKKKHGKGVRADETGQDIRNNQEAADGQEAVRAFKRVEGKFDRRENLCERIEENKLHRSKLSVGNDKLDSQSREHRKFRYKYVVEKTTVPLERSRLGHQIGRELCSTYVEEWYKLQNPTRLVRKTIPQPPDESRTIMSDDPLIEEYRPRWSVYSDSGQGSNMLSPIAVTDADKVATLERTVERFSEGTIITERPMGENNVSMMKDRTIIKSNIDKTGADGWRGYQSSIGWITELRLSAATEEVVQRDDMKELLKIANDTVLSTEARSFKINKRILEMKDRGNLPKITLEQYEQKLKDVLQVFSGFAVPKSKDMMATDEFVLHIHQASGCCWPSTLEKAVSASSIQLERPQQIREVIMRCPRCFGATDKQEPETVTSLHTNPSTTVEGDGFFLLVDHSPVANVTEPRTDHESYVDFIKTSAKAMIHWLTTGLYLDNRRPYRMLTNGMGRSTVHRMWGEKENFSFREDLLFFELYISYVLLVRTSDPEARGGPMCVLEVNGKHIQCTPPHKPNRSTPCSGPRMYFFSVIYHDLFFYALETQLSPLERERMALHRLNTVHYNGILFDELLGGTSEADYWKKRASLGLAESAVVRLLATKNLRQLCERRRYQKYSSMRVPIGDAGSEGMPAAERVIFRHPEGPFVGTYAGQALGIVNVQCGNRTYERTRGDVLWQKMVPDSYPWSYLDTWPVMQKQQLRDLMGIWSVSSIVIPQELAMNGYFDFRYQFTANSVEKLLAKVDGKIDYRNTEPTDIFKICPCRPSTSTATRNTKLSAIRVADCVLYDVSVNSLDGSYSIATDGSFVGWVGRSLGEHKVMFDDGKTRKVRVLLMGTALKKADGRYYPEWYKWISVEGLPPVQNNLYNGGTIDPATRFRSCKIESVETDDCESRIDVIRGYDTQCHNTGFEIFKNMVHLANVYVHNGLHTTAVNCIDVCEKGLLVRRFNLDENSQNDSPSRFRLMVGISWDDIIGWSRLRGEADGIRCKCLPLVDCADLRDRSSMGRVVHGYTTTKPIQLADFIRGIGSKLVFKTTDVDRWAVLNNVEGIECLVGENDISDENSKIQMLYGEVGCGEIQSKNSKEMDRGMKIVKSDIIHLGLCDGPEITQEECDLAAREFEYLGKNYPDMIPQYSFATCMALVAAPNENGDPIYSPEEGETLDEFMESVERALRRVANEINEKGGNADHISEEDIQKLKQIYYEKLKDCGCECGQVPQPRRKMLSLKYPRAALTLHSCISPTVAEFAKRLGWRDVWIEGDDNAHVVKGFTGSSRDARPRTIMYQDAVLTTTGRVYRTYPILAYVMPNLDGMDGIHVTQGNIDLGREKYQIQVGMTHQHQVPTTNGPKVIEVAKFVNPDSVNAGLIGRRFNSADVDGGVEDVEVKTDVVAEKHRHFKNRERFKIVVPLPYPPQSRVALYLDKQFRSRFQLEYNGEKSIIIVCVNTTQRVEIEVICTGTRRLKAVTDDMGQERVFIPIAAIRLGNRSLFAADSIQSECMGTIGIDEAPTATDIELTEADKKQMEELVAKAGMEPKFHRTMAMETDESVLDGAYAENKKWWRKMDEIRSEEADYHLLVTIMGHWDLEMIEEADIPALAAIGLVATYAEVVDAIEIWFGSFPLKGFADEQDTEGWLEGHTMGTEVLDLAKNPIKGHKPRPLPAVEIKLQEMLAQREERTGKLERYAIEKHGILYLVDAAGRAPRGPSSILGRLFYAFAANGMAIEIYCCQSQPELIIRFITKSGTRYYSSNDFSRAFARVKVSQELARWTSVTIGTTTFIPRGGVIGFKPLPAVYTQIVYNRYHAVRSEPGRGIQILAEIIRWRRGDGKSLTNPMAGMLGNRSKISK